MEKEREIEREDPTALKFHTATAATTNNVDEAINFAVCLAEAVERRWAVHGAGKEINGSRAVNFSWPPPPPPSRGLTSIHDLEAHWR